VFISDSAFDSSIFILHQAFSAQVLDRSTKEVGQELQKAEGRIL
jgi:hypothetical protein